MRSRGWATVQSFCCPYEKRPLGHGHTHGQATGTQGLRWAEASTSRGSPKVAGAHPRPESGLEEPCSEPPDTAGPSTWSNVCWTSLSPLTASAHMLAGAPTSLALCLSKSFNSCNPTSKYRGHRSGAARDNELKGRKSCPPPPRRSQAGWDTSRSIYHVVTLTDKQSRLHCTGPWTPPGTEGLMT